MRILLVEDEAELAEPLAEALRHSAYAVDVAADGATADELMVVNTYDLVVLDWTIPGPSGIELLARWRAAGSTVPVLMLTARCSVRDRVNGLDQGADDYLTKPFLLAELLARVRSLLRRRQRTVLATLRAADLVLDRAARALTVADEPVALTPKELAVVEYLLIRCDEVVTRSELVEHVWDDTFDATSNVVDVTIYRLRSKIDSGRRGKLLHTVKGIGYVLRSARS